MSNFIPDDFKDWATGKPIDPKKPEESVRQEYEKILVEDYGYSKQHLDIEVPIKRGAECNRKKNEAADIVVYKSTNFAERSQNAHIIGIVETKAPTKKDGLRQLSTYMSATSAIWGVWTNGAAIVYVYKDPKTGVISDNLIHQIPRYGESFADMGRLKKSDLPPAANLKPVFRRIHATLYANANIRRSEKLGNEMIRLLFCKIWDERYNKDDLPDFYVRHMEKPSDILVRIKKLFDDVKEELVNDGVFDEEDSIKLDAGAVAYVVGELQHYSLTKTDKDVIGSAFEVFAESKLVGEKGEFFTPREVVKTAVQIVDPQPGQYILDPACGSGGFLIFAISHIWEHMNTNRKYDKSRLPIHKKEIAEKFILGIDLEIDLVKISKAYMAIIGDGRGGIVQQNSLQPVESFEGRARFLFVGPDNRFKQFDVILTNPPFGKKSKVNKTEASHFSLGHKWKKQESTWKKQSDAKSTEPGILFVERSLEMLRDGGKLAIVLPETYFHAPNSRYVLEYLCNENNIIAIIDLAHNTFRPHNNAKTLLIVLQKRTAQCENIIMGVAEEIGHDHNGQDIYRYDSRTREFTSNIWDDTAIIRKELNDPGNPKNTNTFLVNKKEIKDGIYVPRYYWNNRMREIEQEAEGSNMHLVELGELVKKGIVKSFAGHGSPEARYKGRGDVPYIRVKDIVNWSIFKNPTSSIPNEEYIRVKGKKPKLEEKDVLFITRGSYRIGSVAILSKYDLDVLLTREIRVFRVTKEDNEYGINAFYLLYLLSHSITQKQLYNKILIDTTLPNIGNRWREIKLPIAKVQEEREKIKCKIWSAIFKKWEAQGEIEDIMCEFGQLTT